jgi:putative ubiquitin-RnfH superfamily antitoxin RatB of RatAB toxin-antitoxin module
MADFLRATVVYARADRQWELPVQLPAGASLRDAVRCSGLLALAPELDGAALDLGVYNRRSHADAPLRDGDRVEVYRPLLVDPMVARRLRAQARRTRRA